jgi:hypothetical protein
MNMDFESTARAIEAREKDRIRAAAKAELDEWNKDIERNTEIKALEKIAGGRFRGRLLDYLLEDYIDSPHPLDAYLEAAHRRGRPAPDLVSRCLKEVRRDYERLLAQAGQGETHE